MLTCMEANLFREQVFFVSLFFYCYFHFYSVILLGNVMFCTCAMQLYRNIFSTRSKLFLFFLLNFRLHLHLENAVDKVTLGFLLISLSFVLFVFSSAC